jgi:hypothetical protein
MKCSVCGKEDSSKLSFRTPSICYDCFNSVITEDGRTLLLEQYPQEDITRWQRGEKVYSEEESALLQSERLKQEASGNSTSPPAGLPFNWGAGLMAPLWLLAHGRIGAGIGLIVLNLVFSRLFALIGPVGLIIDFMIASTILIIVGSNANHIAWKNKKYSSIEEMRRRQKPWLIAGVIISAVVALSIGIVVLSM